MYLFLATLLSFSFHISNTLAATTGPGTTIPVTQNTPVTSVAFTGPFGDETIESVLNRLAAYAVTIGSSVAVLMILYGAFQILTSRGNTKQAIAGRQTILYALGGLVVIILAQGLVSLFAALTRNLGI